MASLSTPIEWTDATWSPITGCTRVSEGCRHCYIERTIPFRMAGRKFVNGTTDVQLHHDRLTQPLYWKRPRRIFVNSLSDLFHEAVPEEFIAKVFLTMLAAPQHRFQVLTKRPRRMLELLKKPSSAFPLCMMVGDTLPNVWLGVSCEDQKAADERIPLLLQTPAAVRFVSLEPLLGPVNLRGYFRCLTCVDHECSVHPTTRWGRAGLNWVIVGGESGPGARPMHPAWVRSIRDQCQAAGVPYFFKQWGGQVSKKAAGRLLDGRTWDEMPKGAR